MRLKRHSVARLKCGIIFLLFALMMVVSYRILGFGDGRGQEASHREVHSGLPRVPTNKDRLRHMKNSHEGARVAMGIAFYEWLSQQPLPDSNQAMGTDQALDIILNDPIRLIDYREKFVKQEALAIVDKAIISEIAPSNDAQYFDLP